MPESILTKRPETIEGLEQFYGYVDKAQVNEFLEQNQLLVPVLYEALPHLRKFFPAAQLLLEYWYDYENPKWVSLFAIIVPTEEPEKAQEKLGQFEDEWWLDAPTEISEKLSFSVEYGHVV